MASIEFTESSLSGPQEFIVNSSGLLRRHGNVVSHVEATEISSVNLRHSPSRFDSARYCCEIALRNGQRLRVVSTSYVGPGSFKSLADDYRAFVFALHDETMRASSAHRVRFTGGAGWGRFALNVAAVLLALPVVLVVLVLAGAAMGVPGFLHLMAFLALLPLTGWWLWCNRPVTYDPAQIPERLLPPGAARIATEAVDTGPRRYRPVDFGPIAEPGDGSWSSAGGNTTHWADAARYADEANEKLAAGLIGPPADPPPQGEQPLRQSTS